ncbi:MAG: hypothetical protein ACO3A2_06820 [Bdellovibrionia bacterium]
MNLKIRSKAPTRIDLAGGTLDLWPLYLFLHEPQTINLGINLFAEAVLETSPSNPSQAAGVYLRSEDQKLEVSLPWEAFAQGESPQVMPALALHTKLLHFFLKPIHAQGTLPPNHSLRLTTQAFSPAGAGLGGSSTLSIALIGALSAWSHALEKGTAGLAQFNPEPQGETFIEIVRDLETTVIQVPAGLQDYYGAMYGGLQSIQWTSPSPSRRHLPQELIHELEDRILLFYSGQSRNSGINNWVLFKDFIDQKHEVRQKFQKISEATQALEMALLKKDWSAVGRAIAWEWETRQSLAPGISTPEIDAVFQKAAQITPLSGKICGAGGGGCFFLYLQEPSPEKRAQLKRQIQEQLLQGPIRPLPFQGVPHGLQLVVETCRA